jgi:DNA-binding GntR family transcriptional regulator
VGHPSLIVGHQFVFDTQAKARALNTIWLSYSVDAGAADAVYATLRDAIIEGLFEPQERLSEVLLAQRFAVSRTPVREALLRLEAEQLATRISRRGLVVRRISAEEVSEVYAVRATLDGFAARLAAFVASPPEIARLRWINSQLHSAVPEAEYTRIVALNIQFHETLFEASHNGLLCQFAKQMHDRVRRFPRTLSYPGQTELAVIEHERIVEAIERGDGDAAERFAGEHIVSTRDARLRETPPAGHGQARVLLTE